MLYLFLLVAVPILATLWAAGLAVMAARRKKLAQRVIFSGIALAAAILAAAAWLAYGSR